MEKLVSIIIPVFNSQNYIAQTLQSCLIQTYESIEIVIVNDGSKDRSESIIFETLKDALQNLNYTYQSNQGQSAARNVGISKSKGEYILFLDSDDLLEPYAITTLISKINSYDVVIGTWKDFDSTTCKILAAVEYKKNCNENTLMTYLLYRPTISTGLIKRSSLIKWDRFLKTWEVTNYFLELFLKDRKFKFIHDNITSIRQHGNANRVSLLNNHFEPTNTSSFFATSKRRLLAAKRLDMESEMILDKQIIGYIYQAFNKKNVESCKNNFKIVNVSLIRNYKDYKLFGLFFFIYLFNGIHGLSFFKKINNLLNRT